MRILVACDAFKDALPAESVCQHLATGLLHASPEHAVTTMPLADGGEGTADLLSRLAGAQMVEVQVNDPLGRPVKATYGYDSESNVAFIDMASASGLQRLSWEERNPLFTSSYGTGQLIGDALCMGAETVALGVGGSATSDGGMGMAIALGARFFGRHGEKLDGRGIDAVDVYRYEPTKTALPRVLTLCDVDNPLVGENGAARIYGPQKGARPAEVLLLEEGMRQLCDVTDGHELSLLPGAGAAGGIGFGTMKFLGAELTSGIEYILSATGFESALSKVDLVITGEGKLDRQTLSGKLIAGVTEMARSAGVPVIAVCGQLNLKPDEIASLGLMAAFSIARGPGQLAEALRTCAEDLYRTGHSIGRMLNAR